MESRNPYQPPGADVSPQFGGGTDQSSPFSPSGRFGRLSFIAWGTILGVISNLATFLIGGSQMFMTQYEPGVVPVMPDISYAALFGLIGIGLFLGIFYVIFSVRRCHDVNASGWWNLLLLVPLANLIFMLFLWIKRGDEDANGFGPARVTPGWEKVVGVIGIVLMVAMLVLSIGAAASAYMFAMSSGA